jgi:hypothetical protein
MLLDTEKLSLNKLKIKMNQRSALSEIITLHLHVPPDGLIAIPRDRIT